jgi:hypothetical protein
MGVYTVPCIACKTPFQWFSGNQQQICDACRPTAKEIAEAWVNFKPVIPISFVVSARKAARNR